MSSSVRSLVLALLLGGCGLGSTSGPVQPTERPRTPGPIESPNFCPTDSVEVGAWAADCVARCLPRTTFKLLCHQAGRDWPHVYLQPDDPALALKSFGRVEAAPGTCPDGKRAWRVFRLMHDNCPGNIPCTMEQIDGVAGLSWPAMHLGECARQGREGDFYDFATKNPNRYWLMDEVIPVE